MNGYADARGCAGGPVAGDGHLDGPMMAATHSSARLSATRSAVASGNSIGGFSLFANAVPDDGFYATLQPPLQPANDKSASGRAIRGPTPVRPAYSPALDHTFCYINCGNDKILPVALDVTVIEPPWSLRRADRSLCRQDPAVIGSRRERGCFAECSSAEGAFAKQPGHIGNHDAAPARRTCGQVRPPSA